ncbi:MAG: hypothetical protein V7750_01195 [Sneathiella sp.]
MTPNPDLLEAVLKLKAEMQSNLAKTKNGDIVDISKLPGRLLDLHNQVQNTPEEGRSILSTALEDILAILDDMSGEIQKRYNEISDQVSILDEGSSGQSSPAEPHSNKKE